jgi:hypothetical protein
MARTIVEWAEHTSGYAGLMRIGMECERVPFEAVITGVRLAGEITQGLGSVVERALEEDWYRPVIDEVVFVVTKRAKQLSEDLSFVVKGPHGETLPRFGD